MDRTHLLGVLKVGFVPKPEVTFGRGPHVEMVGDGILITVSSIPPDCPTH